MTRQWSRLDRRNAGASRHGCNPRHDRAADEEGTCPPHATLVYADKDERAPAALGAPVALSPLQSPLLLLLGSPLVPRQAGAMPPRRLTALFRAVFSAHATRFFHMVHARSFFHVWRFSSSPLSFQLSPLFRGGFAQIESCSEACSARTPISNRGNAGAEAGHWRRTRRALSAGREADAAASRDRAGANRRAERGRRAASLDIQKYTRTWTRARGPRGHAT